MSDHKAEAELLLEQSSKSTGDPTVWLRAAQVYATLYLAEQQRIANRIALAQAVSDVERHYREHGVRAGLVGHEAALYDHPTEASGRPTLRTDVADGLGLS